MEYSFIGMQDYGALALDTLADSGEIFLVSFLIYVLLSFFEAKLAALLEKKKRYAPFFGSLAGAVPQCGISVVGADLYAKDHITIGTLLAIFIACSDEAVPILLGDFSGKWYMTFPLIAIKIVGGGFFGFLVDAFAKKDAAMVSRHLESCEGEETIHRGCCGHEIEEGGQETPLHEHLIHPLEHSAKIFVYVYVISFLFGSLVYWIGEANLAAFIQANFWLSPVFAGIVGLIPNCASSVLLADLYNAGGIPFGALVAGLAVNAGLGPLYLFRAKGAKKKALLIEIMLIVCGLLLGYAFIWIR
jgi:hypothetical protein